MKRFITVAHITFLRTALSFTLRPCANMPSSAFILKTRKMDFFHFIHAISLQEFILHMAGDVSIAEWILLKSFYGRHELRHVLERVPLRRHARIVRDSNSFLGYDHIQRRELIQHRRGR